jgi:GT2 family glycosyltransferase/glycosyltransferase involved in cell wall biosynthesis
MTEINSQDYWNKRFLSDWQEFGGGPQSRFFAELAVELMPAWFLSRIRSSRLTICDWGCAEGEGTAFLREALGVSVEGIDFSSAAITKAQEKFPAVSFTASNLLEQSQDWIVDVMFSSNTLEHFHSPWEVFDMLAKYSAKYVVFLVPYREQDRHPEHFAGFEAGGLPVSRSGLTLVHSSVADTRHRSKSMWPGEQLLAIYAVPQEIVDCGVSLADLQIDTEPPEIDSLARNLTSVSDRITLMEQSLISAINELARDRARHAEVEAELRLEKAERIRTQIQIGATRQALTRSNALIQESNAVIQELKETLNGANSQAADSKAAHLLLETALRNSQSAIDQLIHSKSWRYTRPVRVFSRLVTGRFGVGDRERFRALLFRNSEKTETPVEPVNRVPEAANSHQKSASSGEPVTHTNSNQAAVFSVPTCFLAGERTDKEDVFVWAVIDWNFRTQRPQHLSRALSESGHRVFYISNNLIDSIEPGFSVEPLNESGTLFQIHLNLTGAPSIYVNQPSSAQLIQLRKSLGALLSWTRTRKSLGLVQHPYWLLLVYSLPNSRTVYDCMDNHAGFGNNAASILESERNLISQSDLVIVTSDWLREEVSGKARSIALIRNAAEYQHFCNPPLEVFADEQGRRVIGYYGAIAEWFDVDLVRLVALDHPDCLVLLVGRDSANVASKLADVSNIRFTGEVSYAELPYWLYGFDICLLPFCVNPLTLATNPVKVYEYLSAGKPVVTVELPEMVQFNGLVSIANGPDRFSASVTDLLQSEPDSQMQMRRKRFAEEQSWTHRADSLEQALEGIREPKVSVIVLTYNNLSFTRDCLLSIESSSDYPNLEVIVIDNASTDGSRDWLGNWKAGISEAGHVRKLILNEQNLGFSAGNNIGLAAATGDFLIILNNDTYVTPGWVRTLCGHLRHNPNLGLVGPVTNCIGNEARINISYRSMPEMIENAMAYTRTHPGETLPLHNLAFFCVAVPRRVYEFIGGLDEDFGVGFFEDDDYCRRVTRAGFDIACAEDVFIHHQHSASFDKMENQKKLELFARNRAIYEAKWGAWTPHVYRSDVST